MLTLPRLIEAHARRHPHRLAVTQRGTGLGYADLNDRANVLASRLRAAQVRRETVVGVCLDRSAEWLVAVLAVWKAGGAPLLLDPGWPASQLASAVTSLGARLVLAGSEDAVAGARGLTVPADAAWPPTPDQAVPLHPDNVAYLVLTSGSTGVPKPVGVTHRAVAHRAATHQSGQAIAPGDRSSWLCPPGSSAGAVEVWPYLAAGASVHAADADIAASPPELRDWLIDTGITQCFLSTVTAESLFREPWPAHTALRLVTVGGERARTWPPRDLPFEVANSYGSAEANGVASCLVPWDRRLTSVTASQPERRVSPPMGRPWPGVRTMLLDDHLAQPRAGEPGELYIAGPELARGYLGQPGLTAERFLPSPDPRFPGERAYRSGDLAMAGPDGLLVHRGRTDDQVKINGNRVEPGEIEAALLTHPDVATAAVAAVPGQGGHRLVAWVVAAASGRDAPATEELRDHLLQSLPAFMIPRQFRLVPEIPVTANGKLDRRALATGLAPPAGRPARAAGADPVTEVVLRLWADALDGQIPGPADDFLEHGGDSVTAGRLVATIRAELGVSLRLRDFLRHRTPEWVIEWIRGQGG